MPKAFSPEKFQSRSASRSPNDFRESINCNTENRKHRPWYATLTFEPGNCWHSFDLCSTSLSCGFVGWLPAFVIFGPVSHRQRGIMNGGRGICHPSALFDVSIIILWTPTGIESGAKCNETLIRTCCWTLRHENKCTDWNKRIFLSRFFWAKNPSGWVF